MPLGDASVIGGGAPGTNDVGSIKADDPPSPVSFIPSKYPSVTDGMRVYFERRSGEPTKASLVRPATAGDQLVAIATPTKGLTPAAKRLVTETTTALIDGIAFSAGDDIAKEEALNDALGAAAELGAALEEHSSRVGIAVVRSTIAERDR